MKATSSPLNAKPRSEADAAFAVAHSRHRQGLVEISYVLEKHGAPKRLLDVLEQVQERICNEMAGRIRNG